MIAQLKPIDKASPDEKLVPFDADAEQALLSCLLIQPELLDELEAFPAQSFYVSKHQLIFESMQVLWRQGAAPDLFTLANHLKAQKRLEEVGGKVYLAQLLDCQYSSIGYAEYAKLLYGKYQARRLISASNQIGTIAFAEAIPISDRIDRAQQIVYDITETTQVGGHASHVAESLTQTLERLDSGKPQGIRGASANWNALYNLTGGIFPGHFHVAAGETRTGKTHFGIAQALDYAPLLPVLFISCEMTEAEITDRCLARYSGVDSDRIANGVLDERERGKIIDGMSKLSELNLHTWATSNPSGHEIRAEIRRIARKTGQQVKLVVLDYLQLLRRGNERVDDLDEIAWDCKAIATEFDLCFQALAQVSDRPQNQANKRPSVHDIRGCKAISHHANRIYLLYRDELHNPDTRDRGCMEINVAKNRGGKEGLVKMAFSPACSYFGPWIGGTDY